MEQSESLSFLGGCRKMQPKGNILVVIVDNTCVRLSNLLKKKLMPCKGVVQFCFFQPLFDFF